MNKLKGFLAPFACPKNVWLWLLSAAGLYEAWAIIQNRRGKAGYTLSEGYWSASQAWPGLKWIVLPFMAWVFVHFGWGAGPEYLALAAVPFGAWLVLKKK